MQDVYGTHYRGLLTSRDTENTDAQLLRITCCMKHSEIGSVVCEVNSWSCTVAYVVSVVLVFVENCRRRFGHNSRNGGISKILRSDFRQVDLIQQTCYVKNAEIKRMRFPTDTTEFLDFEWRLHRFQFL